MRHEEIVPCAPWARAESKRALVLAAREVQRAAERLARRARELDEEAFAGRVERLAGMVGIATDEMGERETR